jgi:hypothetical protein
MQDEGDGNHRQEAKYKMKSCTTLMERCLRKKSLHGECVSHWRRMWSREQCAMTP